TSSPKARSVARRATSGPRRPTIATSRCCACTPATRSSPTTGTAAKCSTTSATTSRAAPSRCGPSRHGARRSRTIAAATTPPAAAAGAWISSRPPASRNASWHGAVEDVARSLRATSNPKAQFCMRVLLIDDTPEIAELLSFALRDHGHDVVAVGFDPAVCELVAAQRPDAVVIDCTSLDMAEMLFDALRSTPEYSQLPIVVVSDTPEKADASLRRREAA